MASGNLDHMRDGVEVGCMDMRIISGVMDIVELCIGRARIMSCIAQDWVHYACIPAMVTY